MDWSGIPGTESINCGQARKAWRRPSSECDWVACGMNTTPNGTVLPAVVRCEPANRREVATLSAAMQASWRSALSEVLAAQAWQEG